MRLTYTEERLIELMRSAGGSICPGKDAIILPEVRRILQRLVRRGVVTAEPTDDGPRFTVAGGPNGAA